jgi:hypothetical protein
MVGPHFDKDEANPLNAGQKMSSKVNGNFHLIHKHLE